MDDLINEFLEETNESLGDLDNDLVALEQNPEDEALLGNIFRLVHTIKGTCGFLGLGRLETVAHSGENVLGAFRDKTLKITPEYMSLIFTVIDSIKDILVAIQETGSEPEGNDNEIIAKLDEAYALREGAVTDIQPGVNANDELEAAVEAELARLAAEEAAGSDGEESAENTESGDTEETEETEEATPEPAAPEEPPAPEPATPPPAQDTSAGNTSEKKEKVVATQSLRVSVDVLENLMTMVSELVLTRNQLMQILRTQHESEFTTPLQRLNLVVSDLQEGVMATRMQPIGNAWSKLPRIIRDISLELNKKINLEMHGQETELDRQVLELIKDPLTHMVRNSGDHGIELPADRIAAGKPETGRITLDAYHEGGHIIVKISDDGKGLPLEKIKEKIIANDLASAEQLEEMTDKQIQQYIFAAGFSTAAKVTSVSGRGVGMDVVKTNVEKIGGSIELNSIEGKGSTFTIKIPLTLAIVSALIIESAGQRFAIPQIAVRELVMTSEHGDNRVETIKGSPVLRLRGGLLPLVPLDDLLDLDRNKGKDPQEGNTEHVGKSSNHHIIVTQTGSYSFGIMVDRVFDTEEIVVKPVSKLLRDVELFSGNTILGDGSVIMILDPNGVANATGKVDSTETMDTEKEEVANRSDALEKTSLLLFNAGGKAPKAVPLSLVARIENVKAANIEYSNNQMLIQYREGLMPLAFFDQSAQIDTESNKDIPVLVFSDGDKSIGLIVEQVIDITEQHIDVQLSATQGGLLGSSIIEGKATDVIDVGHYLNDMDSNWFSNSLDPYNKKTAAEAVEEKEKGDRKRRVLLVDDSPFFRNMLTPLLSIAGYDVTTLESPIEALKLREEGAQFDLIVSDIEMPEMDGFEFAEKIKADSGWQDTPLVALSSHATPQDIDRGIEAGFNKYIAKFDRNTLLNTISQTLASTQPSGDAS